MRGLGIKQYQAIIVSEEDYDRGKLTPIPPPKGFDFKRPEPIPEREAPKPPEPVKKVEEAEEVPDFPGGIDF